jgi:hypothetical protein
MARQNPNALSVTEAKLRLRSVIESPGEMGGALPLVINSVRRYPRYALIAGLAAGFIVGAVPAVRRSLRAGAGRLLRY